jgi:nucleoside-diphosphate-sugar epimerase
MTRLVSENACALAAQALGDDRVLVTGASGWLGRTALDMIAPLGLPTLALAGRARVIRVGDYEVECRVWDDAEVRDFSPTVLLDCAFLTKSWLTSMSLDDYIAVNRLLTERMAWAAGLPGVRLALTVSSGAAVQPQDGLEDSFDVNPYGDLKREAEHRLRESAEKSGAVPIVVRGWGLSGAHMQKPRDYALGSMIFGADAGEIRINSGRQVFRRYVLAEELLAVGIAEGRVGATAIDSGGELVEMAELAARVAAVVRPDARITRAAADPRPPDNYHSDGQDWEKHCRKWDFPSADLDHQIEITARGLLGQEI